MIHVLDFNDNIIDYISSKNNYITQATMTRDTVEESDTYDFIIDSDRAYNLRERNRIIVQDRNGVYREYIIVNTVDDIDDLTTVQTNASYVEDLTTAKPYKPGGFTKYTTTQALDDITKDTGWETSDETEFGGIRSSSWTSYQTRYEVARQMRTTYSMELDFYIELSSNSVAHRYVALKEKNAMFKGKEIVYGKDLLTMTRTVDITEIHTALYAIGPEDEEGKRTEVVVTDDEAQEQFGLQGRYIWGVYEPESDDTAMTEARLTTLARTQLNKDKQAAVSYEITSVDLSKQFPHEQISLGDTVRIKDTEFNPPLYVDAEVVGEVYDNISNISTFTFGNVKEYKADELRKDLYDRLNDIQKKMNDNISNVNTIVADVVAGQLEYFERKIIKSDTPPDNPVNDMLWYDTSNPEVAVLRRYWNGEWLEETASDVEQIGGITREKALFSELTNTFTNLSIQHAKLQSDVYEVVTNEYLVDDDLRAAVNNAYNATTQVFDNIKANLDSMTPETATIGKLVDTQALFLKYRERMQTLYKTVENAKIAIDKRFKLLQSQYTDEKFNTAMEQIASTLPNGQWDSENNQLLGDIPSREELTQMQDTLTQYMAMQIGSLNEAIGEETDYKIAVAKDELNASINSVKKEIDGIEIGGRNLIPAFTNSKWEHYTNAIIEDYKLTFPSGTDNLLSNIIIDIEKDANYVFTFNSDLGRYYLYPIIDGEQQEFIRTITQGKDVFEFNSGNATQVKLLVNSYSKNFGLERNFWKLKLEKGTVATDWTPAPEDVQTNIINAQQQATDAAKAYADAQDVLKETEAKVYADGVVDAEEQRAIQDATDKLNAAKTYAETKATEAKNAAINDTENKLEPIKTRVTTTESNIKVLQDGLKLTATKTEVEQTLNDKLTPIQNQVNEQKATLDVLPEQIASKVSQSEYTTDQNNIVNRLNNADTERVQMSNEINDRVTLNEYNGMKIGTRNLLLNSAFNSGLVYWRNVGLSTPINSVDSTFTDLPNDLTNAAIVELTDTDNYEKGIAQDGLKLEVGKEYVFSAWIKVLSGGTTVRLQEGKSRWTSSTFDATTEWQRYEYKFTAVEPITNLYINIPKKSSNAKIAVTGVQLIVGNKNTDYKLSDKDTEQKLTTMQTQINQNGTDINARATKEEFNASRKTLSKVVSDLTINTTTGITLSYDENGAIQSSTVGPDGIKLRGDKVDITVNKEFNVVAKSVNDKVGKDEIINRINLSPENLSINVNNVGIRGGDAKNYIQMKNNGILSYGEFERSWAGNRDRAKLELGINDGRILIRNQNTGYRLYLTERGLSTMMDGFSDDTSGTLEFHSKRFNEASRGITMHSTYGAVALLSEQSTIFSRSNLTNNVESFSYGVYIRPYMNTRPGVNEFNFYVKDNDGAGNTDGALLFGEISDENGLAGSGIRFKKGGIRGYDNMESIVYATDNQGNIGTGSFYANKFYGDLESKTTNLYAMTESDGELRITDKKGYNNGNTNYTSLRAKEIKTTEGGAFSNHSGKNVYFGVGFNELRITANDFYNGGNTKYQNVRAHTFYGSLEPNSSEKYKTNIENWNIDATQTLRDTKLYEYNYIADLERGEDIKKHGVILERETPDHIKGTDTIDLYEMVSTNTKALKEQIERNDELEKKIKQLEEQLNGTK